jgi:hypothetical protein
VWELENEEFVKGKQGCFFSEVEFGSEKTA